jgi:hypothetical protein
MSARAVVAIVVAILGAPALARAQSPELSLRELASGQIKKGVRSIGMGGDGATWGNYALVYNDAGTALIDGGVTSYDNGNTFSFTAVGVTTPPLWHGLAVYAIALSQHAEGIDLVLSSPGLGRNVRARGAGANQAVFSKIAMPLDHGVSIGVLLSYELSQFDAVTAAGDGWVRYATRWRPSGGFGASWQPDPRLIAGVRAILNHDDEVRDDPSGRTEGLARSYEFRGGASASPWQGALVDVGGTVLDRTNGLSGKHTSTLEPNLGFEQVIVTGRKLVARTGLDESTFGLGVSSRLPPFNLDVAYLRDLGAARIGTLFGRHSNSVLVTLTLAYDRLVQRH